MESRSGKNPNEQVFNPKLVRRSASHHHATDVKEALCPLSESLCLTLFLLELGNTS